MEKYPKLVTERFDNANLHINYCLAFINKYLEGDVLEVGAGCGSFTKNHLHKNLKQNECACYSMRWPPLNLGDRGLIRLKIIYLLIFSNHCINLIF